MKNGFSILYLNNYVEWHTELTRKSEAVMKSWGILQFAADDLHAINACVQNAMRDTSYKVEELSTFCTILELL